MRSTVLSLPPQLVFPGICVYLYPYIKWTLDHYVRTVKVLLQIFNASFNGG
jgi:hypothetical protein